MSRTRPYTQEEYEELGREIIKVMDRHNKRGRDVTVLTLRAMTDISGCTGIAQASLTVEPGPLLGLRAEGAHGRLSCLIRALKGAALITDTPNPERIFTDEDGKKYKVVQMED